MVPVSGKVAPTKQHAAYMLCLNGDVDHYILVAISEETHVSCGLMSAYDGHVD